MVRIEKSVEVRASPERVWEMLAFDKAKEWMAGWKGVEYTSEIRAPEDKYKVGASAHITEHVKYDYEIAESLENEKIVWHSAGSRGKPDMTMSHTLKPTETGT
ncbi:MAG: SRPBCC family protein, partial [Candidatus Bathyarchaeota archaeon]|nr:SRPBCC family protein [Candidatus Bathyarchaeota archaeon]